jgi:hypothetical protein
MEANAYKLHSQIENGPNVRDVSPNLSYTKSCEI